MEPELRTTLFRVDRCRLQAARLVCNRRRGLWWPITDISGHDAPDLHVESEAAHERLRSTTGGR
jgi:hypothetical protein